MKTIFKLAVSVMAGAVLAVFATVAGQAAPVNPAAATLQSPFIALDAPITNVHFRNYRHSHGPRWRWRGPRSGYRKHVRWCRRNTRNYNPNTNRGWYRGRRRQCRSPFGP